MSEWPADVLEIGEWDWWISTTGSGDVLHAATVELDFDYYTAGDGITAIDAVVAA